MPAPEYMVAPPRGSGAEGRPRARHGPRRREPRGSRRPHDPPQRGAGRARAASGRRFGAREPGAGSRRPFPDPGADAQPGFLGRVVGAPRAAWASRVPVAAWGPAGRDQGRAGACRPEARVWALRRRVGRGGRALSAEDAGPGRGAGRGRRERRRRGWSALSFVFLVASTSAAPSLKESLQMLNFGQFLLVVRIVN